MGKHTLIVAALCLGCVFGDTNLVASPPTQGFAVQQPVDNSAYYQSYPSAVGGYDYDTGYPVQTQGEEDRQDIGRLGLGEFSVGMVLTAFFAALAGALVAPAITAGISRVMDFELPEITLPELGDEAVEEVRSLEAKYPWVGMVENVYSALRAEVNMRKTQKFDKYINNNNL
eukprot:GFUD01027798.1.p1 GENE.GFUD01027798.1~~GFUD01027798.1.p1  ORF type:complete len:172 (-),score=36.75 GFUD01027798.1:158-673(-)